MARPTDWHVLDLDKDPVPGDPYHVRDLAKKLGDFANDVGTALRSVRGLGGDTALLDWVGLSGEEFRKQYGDLPKELDKLQRSYHLASGALSAYWPQLQHAQAKADKALADARDARAQLNTANTQLTTANDWAQRAHTAAQKYQQNPKPNIPPPNPADVRAAARNAANAQQAQSAAHSAVTSAQDKLDAAKQLAADAAHLRDQAADTCANALAQASHAGIQNKHWWQKAIDFVADHWDDIVAACKVVVAVLGIVVLIIGGPLAWVVVAAALVVLADTVNKYLHGKASLWDVAFAALDCIPMVKGLTTAGSLLKMAREAPELLRSGEALERTANAVRKGASWMRDSSRDIKSLVTCGDPIDMATGEMVMSATDIDLPGVLPLVLERHHRSSYRAGHWFGKSWGSTLDQRLWLDDQGVRFTTTDGMVLYYPAPQSDAPVMPVEGPRWPLSWSCTPGSPMTIAQPETGLTLTFQPLPGQSPNRLPITKISDGNNNTIAIQYCQDGTPVEVTHHGGYRIGIESDGRRITALRLLNHPAQPTLLTYGYDQSGNLATITNSSGLPLKFSYDFQNRITSWEDRNGTWYRYEYDALGRCIRTTGLGGTLDYTYAYDETTRTTRATNSLGHVSVFRFNDAYQVTAETDQLGNTTHSTWDRFDRLLSVTDPLGRTTRYEYDTVGNVTAVTRPDDTTFRSAYDERGHATSITEPDGLRWQYAYDDQGNLIRSTDPVGATTTYAYDAHGALARITDALGSTQLVENDPAGLPISVTGPLGDVTRFARDAFGRVEQVVEPTGGITHIEWTVEGLPKRCAMPDGSVESWTHDAEGNPLSHVDASGAKTQWTITAFDQVSAFIRPDGSRLEFTYDKELRPLSVTAPGGLRWDYEYDAAGQLIAESDFNNRVVRYRYDAAGQITERINGEGQMVRYSRDAMGRVVEQRTDEAVSLFEYDLTGALVRAVSPDAELRFTYDALGRVLTESCNGHVLSNEYDILGRRVVRRTPSGTVSRWDYDRAHQPASLQVGRHHVRFARDLAGQETERRLGPDYALTQEWDVRHQLTQQAVRHGRGAEPVVGPRRYAYRADGLVLSIADQSAAASRNYELDALGRVTSVAAGNHVERYAYDALGNLVHADNAGRGSADMQGERSFTGTLPHTAGRAHYEHDRQGRVVRHVRKLLSGGRHVWEFTWDAEDRLTLVSTPDGCRWRYRYDPLGRRIAKQRLAPDGDAVVEQTNFTWDGTRLAEQAHTGSDGTAGPTLTWDWEPGGDRPLTQTQRDLTDRTDQTRWDERFYSIVTDLIGTPTELLDEEGNVAWQAEASLWGSTLPSPAGSTDCPLRFPGQYFDAETGLHYNHHRYYDPETARYHSPDPLGLEPAPNHHSYVVNPLAWIDPLGLAPECKVLIRHYTSKKNFNLIMGGGGRDGIVLKAGRTAKGNPTAVYVTPMSPADLAKRAGGFKSYLGLTREKSEYMIEFEMEKSKFAGRLKGGRDHVWFSPKDVQIPRGSIRYAGPTSNWMP